MPSDQQLSDVLSEFARTMLTSFPIQAILDQLVRRIVDVMPISAAGVTLISPGIKPRFVAASDSSALLFEQLQTELGEGPCVEAYRTGIAVAMPDLATDSRFPQFTPRALSAGLGAVFTFPLHDGDHRLGALDLYRNTSGSLDGPTLAAAQTLADVASAYLLNAQARADLQHLADQSRDNALHDPLTGLANRTLLLDRLGQAVRRSRRSNKMLAVLFFDLDQFKLINDRYGHGVGDELLVAVTQRLASLLRPTDSLARLSGDEFVVLCEDLDGESDLHRWWPSASVSRSPPRIPSRPSKVNVTASIGVAFAGQGAHAPAQLLHDADAAMYQAKRKGGNRHQVIDLREQNLDEQRQSSKSRTRGCRGARRAQTRAPTDRRHEGWSCRQRRSPYQMVTSRARNDGASDVHSARRRVRPHL